ncbi:MAG: hypothetical protein HY787_23255 [Deltaproteobacteria bacterium]|nr:hypothetical protein [Deltaproteobacteria bacterium]
MLNELYHLSEVLDGIGIPIRDWHKDFKQLPNATPRKPCYKILVGSDGSISGIEPIGNALVSFLRKWQLGSNGYSFPGFNILPLYCISDVGERKLLENWNKGKEPLDMETLKQWCTKKNETKWNEPMLNECLGKIPQELKKRCSQIPEEFVALENLFERVDGAWGNNGCGKFIQALKSYIWKRIEATGNELSLLPILISPKSENISIFLDVPDWEDYPVAHENTIALVNDRLLQSEKANSNYVYDQPNDAFGSSSDGSSETLPGVKLPKIDKVILRAMSKESPCQNRYGNTDAASFRIGEDSRKRTKRALEWLGNPSHEGETWGQADGKELIFAYPAVLPKTLPKLAACFGARRADDSGSRFENYAKDVVDCLKGLAPSLKEIELRVFSLRKMDKARTKVVFHRNYSAQRLAEAASEWQQGCANIPLIRMKSWGEEKGKTILVKPETPFPLQVAECLNRVWKLDGTSKSEVKSIPKSAGIELLLEEVISLGYVPHLLTVALQNGRGLFLSMGNTLHRTEVFKLDGFGKHKQLMPAILGLLLWKLGIKKEGYMNNSPYMVGRMLKLADDLHAIYCKEVRKNSLPPQLLGNALMTAALDSPTQALAQLALRIAPYLGWARTNSTESAGLSRHFLKELGHVEGKLRDKALPTRLDDSEKAQLLLGYISTSNSQTEDPTNN